MPEADSNKHWNVAERVKEELYPQYMEIVRYIVTEGADFGISLENIIEPDENYKNWAKRASFGHEHLVLPLAQLAAAMEEANKARLAPKMLININWQSGQEVRDIEPIERFHFLRKFILETRQVSDLESPVPGASSSFVSGPKPGYCII